MLEKFRNYFVDKQVYMSFIPLSDESRARTFQRMEAYIAEIRTWLEENKLVLNDDKTDVTVTCNFFCQHALKIPSATPKNRLIFFTPSPVVRNICLYMNIAMDMEQQVQKICQSCFFIYFLSQNVSPFEQQVN